MSRLNWRQILTHFLAFWFFIHAFETLSYLSDTRILEVVHYSKKQELEQKFIDNRISSVDLSYYAIWIDTSGFFGLLVAFSISLAISIRRHWFWLNSLIVFIMTFILYKFALLGWTYLKEIFWSIGHVFRDTVTEFAVNGLVLLSIGLLIFFLKKPNTFIENSKIAVA